MTVLGDQQMAQLTPYRPEIAHGTSNLNQIGVQSTYPTFQSLDGPNVMAMFTQNTEPRRNFGEIGHRVWNSYVARRAYVKFLTTAITNATFLGPQASDFFKYVIPIKFTTALKFQWERVRIRPAYSEEPVPRDTMPRVDESDIVEHNAMLIKNGVATTVSTTDWRLPQSFQLENTKIANLSYQATNMLVFKTISNMRTACWSMSAELYRMMSQKQIVHQSPVEQIYQVIGQFCVMNRDEYGVEKALAVATHLGKLRNVVFDRFITGPTVSLIKAYGNIERDSRFYLTGPDAPKMVGEGESRFDTFYVNKTRLMHIQIRPLVTDTKIINPLLHTVAVSNWVTHRITPMIMQKIRDGTYTSDDLSFHKFNPTTRRDMRVRLKDGNKWCGRWNEEGKMEPFHAIWMNKLSNTGEDAEDPLAVNAPDRCYPARFFIEMSPDDLSREHLLECVLPTIKARHHDRWNNVMKAIQTCMGLNPDRGTQVGALLFMTATINANMRHLGGIQGIDVKTNIMRSFNGSGGLLLLSNTDLANAYNGGGQNPPDNWPKIDGRDNGYKRVFRKIWPARSKLIPYGFGNAGGMKSIATTDESIKRDYDQKIMDIITLGWDDFCYLYTHVISKIFPPSLNMFTSNEHMNRLPLWLQCDQAEDDPRVRLLHYLFFPNIRTFAWVIGDQGSLNDGWYGGAPFSENSQLALIEYEQWGDQNGDLHFVGFDNAFAQGASIVNFLAGAVGGDQNWIDLFTTQWKLLDDIAYFLEKLYPTTRTIAEEFLTVMMYAMIGGSTDLRNYVIKQTSFKTFIQQLSYSLYGTEDREVETIQFIAGLMKPAMLDVNTIAEDLHLYIIEINLIFDALVYGSIRKQNLSYLITYQNQPDDIRDICLERILIPKHLEEHRRARDDTVAEDIVNEYKRRFRTLEVIRSGINSNHDPMGPREGRRFNQNGTVIFLIITRLSVSNDFWKHPSVSPDRNECPSVEKSILTAMFQTDEIRESDTIAGIATLPHGPMLAVSQSSTLPSLVRAQARPDYDQTFLRARGEESEYHRVRDLKSIGYYEQLVMKYPNARERREFLMGLERVDQALLLLYLTNEICEESIDTFIRHNVVPPCNYLYIQLNRTYSVSRGMLLKQDLDTGFIAISSPRMDPHKMSAGDSAKVRFDFYWNSIHQVPENMVDMPALNYVNVQGGHNLSFIDQRTFDPAAARDFQRGTTLVMLTSARYFREVEMPPFISISGEETTHANMIGSNYSTLPTERLTVVGQRYYIDKLSLNVGLFIPRSWAWHFADPAETGTRMFGISGEDATKYETGEVYMGNPIEGRLINTQSAFDVLTGNKAYFEEDKKREFWKN